MKITDWPGVGIVLAILAVGLAIAVYVGLPTGGLVAVVAAGIASLVSRRRWPHPS